MKNIDTELNKLKKIRSVSAPPFLWTRIEQRITSPSSAAASPAFRFTIVASLLMLAVANIMITSSFTQNAERTSGIRHLASTMNLSSSNDLYE